MSPLAEGTSSENAVRISNDEIRSELARILESSSFRTSQRCQDFLRYVVEHALTGSHHRIKERTIGVEVFGRSPAYDTSSDGVVRIKASEVRKRLALYYSGAGRDSKVLITIPLGSYLPSISRNTDHYNSDQVNALSVNIDPVLHPESRKDYPGLVSNLSSTRIRTVACLSILVAVVIFMAWIRLSAIRSIDGQFWRPLLGSSEPVLIITSYTPVYLPPARPTSPNNEFRLLTDRYVGGADLVAAVQISSMLTRIGQPFSLRMRTVVTLDDLRDKPTVLIGYASNQLADITKSFRFFIQRKMVTDRDQDTAWRPHFGNDGIEVDDDYAIISRAFDPETHSMLILVSGCTGYGTEEAARLVTDPKMLAAALSGAPKGWQGKNLQLVLHMKVIANSPADTQVVGSYYW
jgi:hypothetical protein